MTKRILLAALFLVGPVLSAQVTSFSIVKAPAPQTDLLVLAGSQRSLFLNITGGTLNTASWSTSPGLGGGTVTLSPGINCTSVSSCNTVDVTVGNTKGSCPVVGTTTTSGGSSTTTYAIVPTVTATVTATSLDDSTKTSTQTFDICSLAVEAHTVPFYATQFANQPLDIQGTIWGAVDVTGTWAITSQPSGGDGTISDTTNRDTVFNASVAGRYTVTFTSNADPTKTASTIVYVTGHAKPSYNATPNGTEPIDCSVDPAFTGGVYDVGPTQTYHNLEAIPWNSIANGSTVRLHNEDTTGSSPTTYPEYIQIQKQATATQPVRLCGVPDTSGRLPVMQGNHATGRSDIPKPYLEQYAFSPIMLYGPNYNPYPNYTNDQFIIIEGIHLTGANRNNTHCPPGSGTSMGVCSTTEDTNAEGSSFRIQNGADIVVRGLEVDNGDWGIFSEFNDGQNTWGSQTQRVLYEGNNVHDNGVPGGSGAGHHNWYMQGWDEVFQFNQSPSVTVGMQGSNFKDRGMGIVRYNFFGPGAARQNDFVEEQDAPFYLNPNYNLTTRSAYPGDAYGGDQLAAAQEKWHHSMLVYGNAYSGPAQGGGTIHFSDDDEGGYVARAGELAFYNNTMDLATNAYRYSLFDTSDQGYTHITWARLNLQNNIFSGFVDYQQPYLSLTTQTDVRTILSRNLFPADWSYGFSTYPAWSSSTTYGSGAKVSYSGGVYISVGGSNVGNNPSTSPNSVWMTPLTCNSNSLNQCDAAGWPGGSNSDVYAGGDSSKNTTTGISNIITTPAITYNAATFLPTSFTAGSPLTGAAARLPVRFQYMPAGHYAIARSTPVTFSNGGQIGSADSGPTPTATSISITLTASTLQVGGTSTITCTATLSDGSTRPCLTPALGVTGSAASLNAGTLTGAAAGSGTVTATAEGFTATPAPFTVTAPAPFIFLQGVTIRGSIH